MDDLIRESLRTGGITCPTCEQHAEAYRRNIYGSMVRVLSLMDQATDPADPWVHAPTVVARSVNSGGTYCGDTAKLTYWGLIEAHPERAGYWMVTARGRSWLRGHTQIRKYAIVYNGSRIDMEGPWVSVSDCLGKKFRLDENRYVVDVEPTED